MDENLARWIYISVAKHFSSVASGLSLPYFVEGINERTEDDMRADHVELRQTGPSVKEVSKNYYTVEHVINALFTAQMDMGGADAYRLMRWTGEFQRVMLEPVPIYKFGAGADDDKSLIGCLVVKKNSADAVRVYYFGQIGRDERICQAEVDAVFEMTLST
jgi:hypothetical protein